jgi:hypothetical protein
MKTCPKCKETKNITEFYMSKGIPGSYCKICLLTYCRTRYAANPEQHLKLSRAWAKANPEKAKYIAVKTKYGLFPEEYDALPKECAICGTTEHLGIDHNHITGEIRGMLCRKHNQALGLFDDDTTMLLRAVDYLMGVLTTKIRCSINERLAKDLGISGRKRPQIPTKKPT